MRQSSELASPVRTLVISHHVVTYTETNVYEKRTASSLYPLVLNSSFLLKADMYLSGSYTESHLSVQSVFFSPYGKFFIVRLDDKDIEY